MEPEIECRNSAYHDSNHVELEHRDVELLNGASDALKSKPEYLDGCKDTNESVCFVLVFYGVAVYARVFDKSMLHKVANLMGVYGKAWIVRRIEHKAAHVGEEGMGHGPVGVSEFVESGYRVSCGEILNLSERRQDLWKENGKGNP